MDHLDPKTVGFCDLLGTPYASVSKIPSVKVLLLILTKSEGAGTSVLNYLAHM
jgi:hypothetical protein